VTNSYGKQLRVRVEAPSFAEDGKPRGNFHGVLGDPTRRPGDFLIAEDRR